MADRARVSVLGTFKVIDSCNARIRRQFGADSLGEIENRPVANSSRVSATCGELRIVSSPRSIEPSYSSILDEAMFNQHLPLESVTLVNHSVPAAGLDFKTWLKIESAQNEKR